MKVYGTRCLPARMQAPNSRAAMPSPMHRFLPAQCPPANPPSLYANTIATHTMLATKISLLWVALQVKLTRGMRNRRASAASSEIRPEGIGLEGLLILSSSGSSVWLARALLRTWIQIQNVVGRTRSQDAKGAEAAACASCGGRCQIVIRARRNRRHDWDEHCLDIGFGEEDTSPNVKLKPLESLLDLHGVLEAEVGVIVVSYFFASPKLVFILVQWPVGTLKRNRCCQEPMSCKLTAATKEAFLNFILTQRLVRSPESDVRC